MSKAKLISLTESLSLAEWSALKKYLLSKTRKDSENYKVFQYLEKNKDKLDQFSIDKAVKRLFPKMSRKAF